MKTIIAGTRTFDDYDLAEMVLDSIGSVITEVVCGGAKGADTIGQLWAEKNGVPCRFFFPSWNTHGKSAGMIRNIRMGDYADALVLFWDGKSSGSKHMMNYMQALKKPVTIYRY